VLRLVEVVLVVLAELHCFLLLLLLLLYLVKAEDQAPFTTRQHRGIQQHSCWHVRYGAGGQVEGGVQEGGHHALHTQAVTQLLAHKSLISKINKQ